MCSILFTNKSIENKKFNRLLQRRGPDKTSIRKMYGYNIVHNLLSLTGDITEQPIEKDGVLVLFNGEIYNYLDIDASSKSDSYSIISAYKKFGDSFVKELDGEFALILIDANKQKIIFSTDVFKTKPLFYSIENENIGLSTFATPLKDLGFNNVVSALPNTSYVIDLNKESIDTYDINQFDLNQYKDSYDDWVISFEESIRKRAFQSGDKKMFIGMSSGYDSGAIACALNKLDVDNKAYAIYASENRNVIDQRVDLLKNIETFNLTNDQYNKWFQYVQENCEDFVSHEIVNHYSIKADKASVGLSFICDNAIKEDRKIYLSGQGADEIFSDYGMFGRKLMGEQQSTFGGIYPSNLSPYFPWKNFFNGTMEMYIAKEEYVAGSFGIETRYPFLDKDVIQEFLWLKPELKNKYYKSVVYEYLNRNNFPIDINQKIGFQANRNLM